MLDRKSVNILSLTSNFQACNICDSTPKILNDLEKLKYRIWNKDIFKCGISELHAHLGPYE